MVIGKLSCNYCFASLSGSLEKTCDEMKTPLRLCVLARNPKSATARKPHCAFASWRETPSSSMREENPFASLRLGEKPQIRYCEKTPLRLCVLVRNPKSATTRKPFCAFASLRETPSSSLREETPLRLSVLARNPIFKYARRKPCIVPVLKNAVL